MPKYSYKCNNCKNKFVIFHSMAKLLEDCDDCGAKKSLVRVPSTFFYNPDNKESHQQVGALVKESIEEFKSDLESEKERIRNKEWEKND